MNYKVEIDAGILKVRIAGNHNIWMHRAPRTQFIEAKSGIYVLADERGYCCYVGETDNFKNRMADHESRDRFCWWTHTIYFWDASPGAVFSSKDDRRWYEEKMKMAIESKHPTFTKNVQHKPKPYSGDDVIKEMLALLDVVGFETNSGDALPVTTSTGTDTQSPPYAPAPTPILSSTQTSSQHLEPRPYKNHHPPLGAWPNYTALAKAIAERRSRPKTAGFIRQILTNYWTPTSGRYVKANSKTRQMLESFGVAFDNGGFVKSCAGIPCPLV